MSRSRAGSGGSKSEGESQQVGVEGEGGDSKQELMMQMDDTELGEGGGGKRPGGGETIATMIEREDATVDTPDNGSSQITNEHPKEQQKQQQQTEDQDQSQSLQPNRKKARLSSESGTSGQLTGSTSPKETVATTGTNTDTRRNKNVTFVPTASSPVTNTLTTNDSLNGINSNDGASSITEGGGSASGDRMRESMLQGQSGISSRDVDGKEDKEMRQEVDNQLEGGNEGGKQGRVTERREDKMNVDASAEEKSALGKSECLLRV